MIDPMFGHWLAGFADGEGSFSVGIRETGNAKHYCAFQIQLRADDRAILDEIQVTLDLGAVYAVKRYGGNRKDQAAWRVGSKADCLALRAIFEQYPLRAKKKRDFEIWSEALEHWVAHQIGDSWEPMALAKMRLEAGRVYQ